MLDDADLDLAVDGAVWGAFGTSGQRCTSTSRLIVQGGVYDQVLDRVVQRAKALRLGNPRHDSTQVGPLINARQLQRVLAYIAIGLEEGAGIACGGRQTTGGEFDPGWFVQPTVFDRVTSDMRVFQEEIFGPVLSVISPPATSITPSNWPTIRPTACRHRSIPAT